MSCEMYHARWYTGQKGHRQNAGLSKSTGMFNSEEDCGLDQRCGE